MPSTTYRRLQPDDLHHFADIDRAEVIDGRYAVVDGQLTLEPFDHVVTGWYPSELVDHPAHIREMIAGGGCAFGAFDGDRMVGIAALKVGGVGGDPAVMQLEPLQVSAGYRNQGIGRSLVRMVADAAQAMGATALYISSIPTRNTVDAYIRMGAVVLDTPDPDLYDLEPDDIHLLLRIGAHP